MEPAGTKNHGGDNSDQDTHISDLILFELLCRLPSKDVFRLKCVCKRWLSFISDPSFGSLYLSRQASFQPSPFVIFDPEIGLVDDEEYPKSIITKNRIGNFPQFRKLNIPSLRERLAEEELGFQVIAADKGFLLLEKQKVIPDQNYISEYYICNAVTKQWITLPALRVSSTSTKVGLVAQIEGGVVLTSFRVVIFHCKSSNQSQFEVQMFSSEIGAWVDLKVECDHSIEITSSARARPPVVLNTTIYWLSELQGILAYDPCENLTKVRIIEIPRRFGGRHSEIYPSECGKGRQRLKYVMHMHEKYQTVTLKTWELHDNDRWEIQHSIVINDVLFTNTSPKGDKVILRNCLHAEVVAAHPFDPDVVFLYWKKTRSLVAYNLETNRMESLNEYWPCGGYDPMIGLFQVFPLWPISFHPFLCFGFDD